MIGRPLAAYRPDRRTNCANDAAAANFVARCQLGGDAELHTMLGGAFTPSWSTGFGAA